LWSETQGIIKVYADNDTPTQGWITAPINTSSNFTDDHRVDTILGVRFGSSKMLSNVSHANMFQFNPTVWDTFGTPLAFAHAGRVISGYRATALDDDLQITGTATGTDLTVEATVERADGSITTAATTLSTSFSGYGIARGQWLLRFNKAFDDSVTLAWDNGGNIATFTVNTLPTTPRIRLLNPQNILQNTTDDILLHVKFEVSDFTEDLHSPGISDIDDCLAEYATGDMWARQRQYGKKAECYKAGSALLMSRIQKEKNEQAYSCQIVPADIHGSGSYGYRNKSYWTQ
jgi:hypothetical protein